MWMQVTPTIDEELTRARRATISGGNEGAGGLKVMACGLALDAACYSERDLLAHPSLMFIQHGKLDNEMQKMLKALVGGVERKPQVSPASQLHACMHASSPSYQHCYSIQPPLPSCPCVCTFLTPDSLCLPAIICHAKRPAGGATGHSTAAPILQRSANRVGRGAGAQRATHHRRRVQQVRPSGRRARQPVPCGAQSLHQPATRARVARRWRGGCTITATQR